MKSSICPREVDYKNGMLFFYQTTVCAYAALNALMQYLHTVYQRTEGTRIFFKKSKERSNDRSLFFFHEYYQCNTLHGKISAFLFVRQQQ